MPPVILAIAGVLTTFGVGAATATFIATEIVTIVITTILAVAAKALAPKPKSGKSAGLLQNYTSTEASMVWVYGQLRVGGMDTIPSITSNVGGKTNGAYLNRVLTIAGRAVNGLSNCYLNSALVLDAEIAAITGATGDGVVSTAIFGNASGSHLWIRRYLGVQTTPDWKLSNEVSTTAFTHFVGKTMTYAAITMWWDPNIWAAGVPTYTFDVNGHSVYDPRLDSTNGGSGGQTFASSASWLPSNNPALVAADYLTQAGSYAFTEVNWADVIAAANICDQVVAEYQLFGAAGSWTQHLTHTTIATNADGTIKITGAASIATDYTEGFIAQTGMFRGSIKFKVTAGNMVAVGLETNNVYTNPNTAGNVWSFVIDNLGGINIRNANVTLAAFNVLTIGTGDVDLLEIAYDGTSLYFFAHYIYDGNFGTTAKKLLFVVHLPTASIGVQMFPIIGIASTTGSVTFNVGRRYSLSGQIALNDQFTSNLTSIIDAMLGKLIYANGVWRMFAGGWTASSSAVNENDWVSNLQFQFDGGRDQRFNRVRNWYIDPLQNWQRVECYPRANPTYQTADGGEWIDYETDQPFCLSEPECQRKAEMVLRQSRNSVTVSGKLPPRFQYIQMWDTASVTHGLLGWLTKNFIVTSCAINVDGSVDVVLKEGQSSDWTDLLATDYNTYSKQKLPSINPTTPDAPSSLTIANVVNGTLDFTIGVPLTITAPMTFQIVRSSSMLANPNSLTFTVWEGAGNYARVACPTSTNYYWACAYSNPNSPGPFFPSVGSAGVAGAAVQLDRGQVGPNIATSLVGVASAVTSNGVVCSTASSLNPIIAGNITCDSYTYGIGIDFSMSLVMGTLLGNFNSMSVLIYRDGAPTGTAAFDVRAAAAVASNGNLSWGGQVTLDVTDAPAVGVHSYQAMLKYGQVFSGTGANASGATWSNPVLKLREYAR